MKKFLKSENNNELEIDKYKVIKNIIWILINVLVLQILFIAIFLMMSIIKNPPSHGKLNTDKCVSF